MSAAIEKHLQMQDDAIKYYSYGDSKLLVVQMILLK